MRINFFRAAMAVALAVVTGCAMGLGHSSLSALAQERKPAQLSVSAEEQNLAKAIMSAPDPAAKLKAAAALIDKYPKTLLGPRVAKNLAEQIAGVTDASQKIGLAQEYQKIFKEQSEQDFIVPVLIDGYASANRPDEAFSTGSNLLARQPDALRVLVRLTLAGTEEAKKKNVKFIAASLQYGAKAIELIEADKRPADVDDIGWSRYKAVLPGLYQSMGILSLLKGDHGEAKARLAKAAELAPSDAFNYLLLAGILNDEYQTEAKRYQSMPDGQAKRDEAPRVLAMMDGVIDAYAHMIALSEGNAAMQQVRQQYLQDLETYYKYRHHNSTDGLQQLIDKYKVAAR